MKKQKYVWQDIYPELVNKLRWAICSSFTTPESNYPYGDGQAIATVLSQLIIDLVKEGLESPGLTVSTAGVRRSSALSGRLGGGNRRQKRAEGVTESPVSEPEVDVPVSS